MNIIQFIIFKVILNPIVLFCVAVITGGVGILLLFDSPAYADRSARAERLAPSSAAVLADLPADSEVLLEGRISRSTTVVYRDFVAYVREEYRDEILDGTSTQHWVEVERNTPPLLLTLADGEARIANDDYILETTAVTVEEAAPTLTKGAVQSRGFVADSPVLTIGRVDSDGAITAEFVYAGTRSAYIEEMNRISSRSLPVGIVLLVVCTASVVAFVWQIRRVFREIAAEQAAEAAIREQQDTGKRKSKRP